MYPFDHVLLMQLDSSAMHNKSSKPRRLQHRGPKTGEKHIEAMI